MIFPAVDMGKEIICLGIESTAHTFGIGIAKVAADSNGSILSNVIKQFTTKTGGIIPAEAAEHHV